jgi:hypothetical protein
MRYTWLVLLSLILCSCSSKDFVVKPSLTISCAPEVLDADQWAVLTVLHIHESGIAPVKVRESELAKVALFARRIEVFDSYPDGSGYSMQVYVVKPFGTSAVDLTSRFFENAPSTLPGPVTLRVSGNP